MPSCCGKKAHLIPSVPSVPVLFGSRQNQYRKKNLFLYLSPGAGLKFPPHDILPCLLGLCNKFNVFFEAFYHLSFKSSTKRENPPSISLRSTISPGVWIYRQGIERAPLGTPSLERWMLPASVPPRSRTSS
jgi:hypothetical protein